MWTEGDDGLLIASADSRRPMRELTSALKIDAGSSGRWGGGSESDIQVRWTRRRLEGLSRYASAATGKPGPDRGRHGPARCGGPWMAQRGTSGDRLKSFSQKDLRTRRARSGRQSTNVNTLESSPPIDSRRDTHATEDQPDVFRLMSRGFASRRTCEPIRIDGRATCWLKEGSKYTF